MYSVFLSHNWRDKPFVRQLGERLRREGIKVWIDEAEINVGDSLIRKISGALERNDFVVAIISPNSIGSNWVLKELSLAMTKEIAGGNVVVLPLLIELCEVPDFLKDKLYADFTDDNNFEREFSNLLRAIKAHREAPATAKVPEVKSGSRSNHPSKLPYSQRWSGFLNHTKANRILVMIGISLFLLFILGIVVKNTWLKTPDSNVGLQTQNPSLTPNIQSLNSTGNRPQSTVASPDFSPTPSSQPVPSVNSQSTPRPQNRQRARKPELAPIHINKARGLLGRGEYQAALAECDMALKSDPGNREAINLRGLIMQHIKLLNQ